MTRAQSLLESLTLQGIDLWLDGEQLRYRGPKAVLTPERLGQLKRNKSDLLHCLTTTTYKPAQEQQRAYVAYQETSQKAAHHVTFAAHLHGALDEVAFQRAWQTLVNRHATLRTTYSALSLSKGAYEQAAQNSGINAPSSALFATVYGTQPLTVRQIEAQNWHEQELQTQLAVYQARPFDLTLGPLLCVTLFARAKNQQILLVSAPHITLDELSLARLLNEFGQLYSAAQRGGMITLSPLVTTPAMYAAWQAGQRQLPNDQTAVLDEELVLNLPVDYPRHAQQKRSVAQESFQLVPDLVLQLNRLVTTTETTLDTLLLAAFQVLLHRYTSQNAFSVDITIEPRHHPEFTDLMGGFTTNVGLRTDVAANDGEFMTFTALLTRTHQQTKVAQRAEASAGSGQVAFVMRHRTDVWMAATEGRSVAWGELDVTPFALADIPDSLELKLELVEVEGGTACPTVSGITGTFHYRTDLLAPERIGRMVGHYRTLLNAIATDPNQSIATMPLLTAAERQQILVEWNNTATDYPKDKCIHQLFEGHAAAERTPDAIAVVFGEQQLTYQELNQRANQLAHYLISLGVGPETLVGICMERSVEMVVGLLAILKAGGAYVPLDPVYPQERLAFMLQDANISILLTQKDLVTEPTHDDMQVIDLDRESQTITASSSENPIHETTPTNLAYVIYTSGSTGKPKGVMIEHGQVLAMLFAYELLAPSKENLSGTSVCSYNFDVSVWEFFSILCFGGTLHILTISTYSRAKSLVNYLSTHAITSAYLPPMLLIEIALAYERTQLPVTLKRILVGVEPIPQTVLQRFRNLSPSTSIINGYGPTECTICSSFYDFSHALKPEQRTPIGKPLANYQIYLCDANLQPVSIGVKGEILIGGAGIGRCYLNRPKLTREKFIDNPFGEGRLYRTGDLARWLPDGNLEFLGRIDNQVKLRGFRIELGEIETVLTRHLTVQDALVMLREDTVGDKRLVAYVVIRSEKRVTGTQNAETLRAYLLQKLPNYMVPRAVILLDALPLTPNGKVDRKALPAPEEVAESSARDIVPPSNPIEGIIANIWCDVMNRTQVGIHDNFFDLGGHSLQATQVIDQIRRIFRVQFPLSRFFEASTVAELAQLLIKYESKPGQIAKLARLQQRLNKLTK